MSGGHEPADLPLETVLARWDALAQRWALDDQERSALLGGTRAGPVDDVATYDLVSAERRIRLLVELDAVLVRVFADDEHTRRWLRRANRNLGGRMPVQVIARSPEWARWLIHAIGIAT